MSLSQEEIDEVIEELIELDNISDNARTFLSNLKALRNISEDRDSIIEEFYPEVDEEFEDDPFSIDEDIYGVDDYGYAPDDDFDSDYFDD